MDRIQTVALWIVAVSLAVLAVFSGLNYFDTDAVEEAHREAEVDHSVAEEAHWDRIERTVCAAGFFSWLTAAVAIEGNSNLAEGFQGVTDALEECLVQFGLTG